MYDKQDYALQIDSHMLLVDDWDTRMIKALSQCPDSSHAILSVYPRPINIKDKTVQDGPPCAMSFNCFSTLDGLPRFKSRPLAKKKFEKPFKSLFWAAGFSFSRGQLLVDCPYTGDLDYVFFGEELF